MTSRLAVLVVAVLTASTLHAPPVRAADAAVAADSAVAAAQDHVARAQAALERVTGELDAAAGAFEHAQAHSLRLEDELADVDQRVAAAHANADAAADAFADRVAQVYMRPALRAELAEAVLSAPDGASALHRAALLQRITINGAADVTDAGAVEAATTDAVREHRIVQAGSYAAADDRRRLAEQLTVAVGNAQHLLAQAQGDLAAEEEAAQRRQEERERAVAAAAADAARLATAVVSTAPPPVSVGGKVCPIGSPNGFIDSYGFPRSGGRRHQGIDMFAAYGMPLYAVADGTIARVGTNRLGGLSIHLIDDAGDRYYYAHLSGYAVQQGQRVRAGDVIGANGDSGNARGTPPHLHWQYHPGGGAAVNPYALARALCR